MCDVNEFFREKTRHAQGYNFRGYAWTNVTYFNCDLVQVSN